MTEREHRAADLLRHPTKAGFYKSADLGAIDLRTGEYVGDGVDDQDVGPKSLGRGHKLVPYRLKLQRARLPVPQRERVVEVLSGNEAQIRQVGKLNAKRFIDIGL